MIGNESGTDTDDDDILEGFWSLKRRKRMKSCPSTEVLKDDTKKNSKQTEIVEQVKAFEELKRKSSEISTRSSLRLLKTETRRSQKILKRALRDPWIKMAVEGEKAEDDGTKSKKKEITEWKDVKPYLSVNKNLQSSISHGNHGPKTELEYKIEDCIKEGDFEKAELLSDTLADREFAMKIASAFDAKKFKEEREKQKEEERQKEKKKIRWMFDPKERWQMKGSM